MAKAKKNAGMDVMNTDGIIRGMVKASQENGGLLTQKSAAEAISLLKQVVIDQLADGGAVQLTGFCSMRPTYRPSRKGNNVITGESMDIPEGVIVSIKAGKGLKTAVKELDPTAIRVMNE